LFELQIANLYTRVNKKRITKEEADALSTLLSVRVPGYFFSKAYKMGRWDGFTRFYNRGTGQFYTGLLGYVKSHLTDAEFEEIDVRQKVSSCSNILFLKGITPRPYQEQMIAAAVEKERGIICAPPNAGKTEVAAGIIQVLGHPANFFTHRLTLLHQTKERFEDRLGIKVGIVGRGEVQLEDVNILSVASVAKKLEDPLIKDILKNFPVVFSDECHHISALTWAKCLKESGAYYRYGLSATPLLRDDISNMTVRGLLGEEIASVTNEELMDLGISATPSVYLFEINFPTFPRHYPYDKVYEESIVFGEKRNGLIVSSAKRFVDQHKSVFIIVFRIQHGQFLTEMLQKAGVEAEFISGEGSTPERNHQVLKMFAEKKIHCVVSTSISDEGLDIPAMDVLIIGVGDKSALKAVQRVGRGLRKKKQGENIVTVIDFVDVNNSHLQKHSQSRLTVYVNLGMKIYEVRNHNWDNVVKV